LGRNSGVSSYLNYYSKDSRFFGPVYEEDVLAILSINSPWNQLIWNQLMKKYLFPFWYLVKLNKEKFLPLLAS
jgi:hypothetical protein